MSTTVTTLVTGIDAVTREKAILAALQEDRDSATAALILEGLPGGLIPSEDQTGLPELVQIARIAPGCVCCTGNLTMQVTLNRILRRSPHRLYIGLASTAHIDAIRAFLTAAPYDTLLSLTQDLSA